VSSCRSSCTWRDLQFLCIQILVEYPKLHKKLLAEFGIEDFICLDKATASHLFVTLALTHRQWHTLAETFNLKLLHCVNNTMSHACMHACM
jgi:hypothetical protein